MSDPKTEKLKTLSREIFGASDDDDDDLNLDEFAEKDLIFSDDEEVAEDKTDSNYISAKDLPSFKKRDASSRTPKSKKEKKKRKYDNDTPKSVENEDVDPEQAKINEARRDVEEALNRIKPKKVKRDLVEESAIDEMMVVMLQKMKQAAETDHELNKLKQPAVAKLKMLPAVQEQLNKANLFEQFMDNNILEGIKMWLEPMLGDGSLPSLDIQRVMMTTLMNMPIRTTHLRESGVGRVVMFYSKCLNVVPEIKKIVRELLDKWMRPILNRSDNYKDRVIKEVEFNPLRMHRDQSDKDDTLASLVSTSIQNRARIPTKQAPVYDFAPKFSVMAPGGDKKVSEKFKKLKNKMTNIKRKGNKTGKMSIEGR